MCENCLTLPQLSLTSVLTADRAGAKSVWIRARKAETNYAKQLRKVARHVGDIVSGFDVEDLSSAPLIEEALRRYAGVISGWAEAAGSAMVAEVAARDLQAWNSISKEMGSRLRQEIANAPTGQAMRKALNEQTRLITSLPTEAADRVRQITLEGITKGTRASEIAAEIMRTGEVTQGRANTIARTEVSRTTTELTKARAEHVGSTHFIWRTAGDSDVRPTHRALNGKAFRWDDPPECDPGYHALPGAIWNCRCWPEVVVPED
ncbi:SPP1 gp7 family putative phage head morphogenesis protein [Kaistia dalseonensis]|uniref:SPP1 gp7 family putative phage head morphogenesis protein n=1 Tax=Kaistia dalseonensis TaxID=410840 RepID=A0ABU0H6Q6_9HYPH|nr:SPP1 gp7 family putative phage head morphogenesis protein [Kaistia dalseonensis]